MMTELEQNERQRVQALLVSAVFNCLADGMDPEDIREILEEEVVSFAVRARGIAERQALLARYERYEQDLPRVA